MENNRQQDHAERLAIAEYRDGHIADALARYDDADKIVRSATAGASLDAMTADWYAARLSGHADPMIAGPNSTRQALNDRARTLLKGNGELSGEPLVIAGREFMVGDEVVARRNDRLLREPEGRGFVKNGSTGSITDVDLDSREVIVRFVPEGTIRIPNDYLRAGRLEHGYARTTYGVQGATHDIARYQPTDVSSFEEGYVALTRGRQQTRIYIVEGGQTDVENDEATYAVAESRRVGIADVARALGRRRSSHMAADVAPDLDAVAQTLVGASLVQLAARRRQLDGLIRQAPADASPAIERALLTLESIRTRQRAWTELLQTGEAETADPQAPRSGRGPAGRDFDRARAALEALDRAHANMLARLDKAEVRQARREEWRDAHADLIDARELVSRAERAREIQVRVAAINNPDSAVRDLLGPEPTNQRERLLWRRAVEATAVYNARYPRRPGLGTWATDPRTANPPAPMTRPHPRSVPSRWGDRQTEPARLIWASNCDESAERRGTDRIDRRFGSGSLVPRMSAGGDRPGVMSQSTRGVARSDYKVPLRVAAVNATQPGRTGSQYPMMRDMRTAATAFVVGTPT